MARKLLYPWSLGCLALLLAAGVTGCSDDDSNGPDAFVEPDATPTADSAVADASLTPDAPVTDGGLVDTLIEPADSGGPCSVAGTGAAGIRCGDECVDPLTNAAHCGGCSVPVGRGNACVGGVIRSGCPKGQSFCKGRCIDVSGDPNNCGGCGDEVSGANVCLDTQRCELIQGVPTCTCPIDASDIIDDENGTLKAPGLRRWRDCRASGSPSEPRCVDTWTDADHCNGCNNACTSNFPFCARADDPQIVKCRAGGGDDPCPGDAPKACGNDCVDSDNDPFNCGSCGNVCGPNRVCTEGVCTCREGLGECNGGCFDFAEDPVNCGGCAATNEGVTCSGLQTCGDVAGKRQCICPANRTSCNGACVNTLTDNDNCGDCGNKCPGNSRCVNGNCSCPEGFDGCDALCLDIDADPFNCGACFAEACGDTQRCAEGKCVEAAGSSCPEGLTECGRTSEGLRRVGCVNTQTDINNCGGCSSVVTGTPTGVVCGQDQICKNGACACANGGKKCAGTCVDTDTNPHYCGECNVACELGQVCVAGKCVTDCPAGLTLCEGHCVDTMTNLDNCGGCGNLCFTGGSGSKCVKGACTSEDTDDEACPGLFNTQCYPDECRANPSDANCSCRNISNDEKNCGDCNNPCATGKTCQSNAGQDPEDPTDDFTCQ